METWNIRFDLNPNNPCVANRENVGKKHTVRLHVDTAISTHVNPKVNDKFKEWTNNNYDKHGEVNINRVKVHKYLVLTFYLI